MLITSYEINHRRTNLRLGNHLCHAGGITLLKMPLEQWFPLPAWGNQQLALYSGEVVHFLQQPGSKFPCL